MIVLKISSLKFLEIFQGQPKGRFRKEYIRASTGLFGGNETKLETDDPFASGSYEIKHIISNI